MTTVSTSLQNCPVSWATHFQRRLRYNVTTCFQFALHTKAIRTRSKLLAIVNSSPKTSIMMECQKTT